MILCTRTVQIKLLVTEKILEHGSLFLAAYTQKFQYGKLFAVSMKYSQNFKWHSGVNVQ